MNENQSGNHADQAHQNKFFVDQEKFDWSKDTITGADLRTLAAVPNDVQIFQKIPGHPDFEITSTTIINLAEHQGPIHFSTQATGSQAG